MSSRQALIIVGSPRRQNSHALAEFFAGLLSDKGMQVSLLRLTEVPPDALLARVREAELIVFSFPLYVDSPPAMMMAALEYLATELPRQATPLQLRAAAIVNCGFPEAQHNSIALEIMQHFARKAGLAWAGGLSLGGGESLGGRPVGSMAGMLHHAVSGMQLAATELAGGGVIPDEAKQLMSRPIIPPLAYRLAGGIGFRQQLKRNKVKNAGLKPYQR